MIVLLLIIFFDKVERKFRYEVDVKFMWIGFVNAMGEMFLSLYVYGDKWKVNKVKI